MLTGVVLIRGNDGGVVVDCGGAGKKGVLLNKEVLPCTGSFFSILEPNRGEGACVPDMLPGCDIFDDDAVCPMNGFVKPGESDKPNV